VKFVIHFQYQCIQIAIIVILIYNKGYIISSGDDIFVSKANYSRWISLPEDDGLLHCFDII